MLIQDKLIFKLLTTSLALNFVLLIATSKIISWSPCRRLHNCLTRLSGYLTLLAIYAEFSEELEEMGCAT